MINLPYDDLFLRNLSPGEVFQYAYDKAMEECENQEQAEAFAQKFTHQYYARYK